MANNHVIVMLSDLEEILQHVMATLPDSLERRKRLLELSANALPPGHTFAAAIRDSLQLIYRHEIAQRELNLSLDGTTNTNHEPTKPQSGNPDNPGS